MLTNQERFDIAARAARRYSYIKWVDQDDARQEALAAILAAENSFSRNPDGQNVHGYVTRAAQYAVRWFVWSMTSPVKHTNRGRISEQVTVLRRASEDEVAGRASGAPTPEQEVSHGRWAAAVRERLAALMSKDAECDKQIAERVLLDDETPEDVARSEQVPVRAVYVVTQRVRQRIFKDVELLTLLLEKLER
jgi:DNA-directed RNA polymerase specialized sigma24 family protein